MLKNSRGVVCTSDAAAPVGADARPFDGRYVLLGAVGGVARDPARSRPPAEERPPQQQVEHRLVLHDICRGDQGREDYSRLTSVHDVVGVVANREAPLLCCIKAASGSVRLTS